MTEILVDDDPSPAELKRMHLAAIQVAAELGMSAQQGLGLAPSQVRLLSDLLSGDELPKKATIYEPAKVAVRCGQLEIDYRGMFDCTIKIDGREPWNLTRLTLDINWADGTIPKLTIEELIDPRAPKPPPS